MIFSVINTLFNSSWASHRQVSCLLIEEIFKINNNISLPKEILFKLNSEIINDEVIYTEILNYYNIMHKNTSLLLQIYGKLKLDIKTYLTTPITKSLVEELTVGEISKKCFTVCPEKYKKDILILIDKINISKNNYINIQNSISLIVHNSVSSSLVWMNIINNDFRNKIYKTLLKSIEIQSNINLQTSFAITFSKFIYDQNNDFEDLNTLIIKEIKNLILLNYNNNNNSNNINNNENDNTDNSINNNKSLKNLNDINIIENEEENKINFQLRGYSILLNEICKYFKENLFNKLKIFEDFTFKIISNYYNKILEDDKNKNENEEEEEELKNALIILNIILVSLDKKYEEKIIEILKFLIEIIILIKKDELVTKMIETISITCKIYKIETMKIIINKIIPMLSNPKNLLSRRISSRIIESIILALNMDILPFVVFFIVPLLKRMSDHDEQTRNICSICFGILIKILPLEKSVPEIEGLEITRKEERKFLEQLLDSSKIEPYEIPVKINAELREYQKEGVSWLNFLNKFSLHGILCGNLKILIN
jgi:TATA-binding protein-associated factor